MIVSLVGAKVDYKEFFYVIKEKCPELPVVIISAKDESEAYEEFYAYGQFHKILRPITGRKILEVCQAIIAKTDYQANAVVQDNKEPMHIRLRQILVNLLNNAVKYTHKGSVTLEITRKQSEEGVAKLFFQVKDTGIGIKEEDLEKLCQPFERIEEKRNRNIEGTRLGMSITKQLLGLLNSELKVASVYGEGSEFAFELI